MRIQSSATTQRRGPRPGALVRFGAHVERFLDGQAPKSIVDGVMVVDRFTFDDGESPALLEKVQSALHMIRDWCPTRYNRILSCVDLISIRPLRAGGYFNRQRREIKINGDLVAHHDYPSIALYLIHEATHARIAALGVISTTHDERTREEMICEKQVRKFIAKIAATDSHWAVYLEKRSSEPLPAALTDQEYWDLRAADMSTALKHLKAAPWVIALAERMVKRVRRVLKR